MNHLLVDYSIYKMAGPYYGNFCWDSTRWGKLIQQETICGMLINIVSNETPMCYYTEKPSDISTIWQLLQITQQNNGNSRGCDNCLGCLKQFQQISKNPYTKTRLDLGWELPIISMPASNINSSNVWCISIAIDDKQVILSLFLSSLMFISFSSNNWND